MTVGTTIQGNAVHGLLITSDHTFRPGSYQVDMEALRTQLAGTESYFIYRDYAADKKIAVRLGREIQPQKIVFYMPDGSAHTIAPEGIPIMKYLAEIFQSMPGNEQEILLKIAGEIQRRMLGGNPPSIADFITQIEASALSE